MLFKLAKHVSLVATLAGFSFGEASIQAATPDIVYNSKGVIVYNQGKDVSSVSVKKNSDRTTIKIESKDGKMSLVNILPTPGQRLDCIEVNAKDGLIDNVKVRQIRKT